ncbi:MAG: PAS domain S-box protein, partial [Candidatus Lokiarchaeota archaeon]|nr:PAS domain S-box protein [Candidatus Lokiarchaeota archaeon]
MMRNIKPTEERKGLTEISYCKIFKNLSEMVIIFDKKGKILDLNTFAFNKLRYNPNEIEFLSIQDIVDKDYWASLQKCVKKLDLLKSMTIKLVYITKDKSLLPVEVILWKSSDYTGQIIVCIAREENNTLKSIDYKKLYKKMESVLDHFPGLIFLKDKKNNLLMVNKFMAEAHNLKKEEMIGLNCFEIYPKDQAQAYWDDDLEIIKSGRPKLFIEEPWEHNGKTEWISTSKIPIINNENKIEGVLGFSFDITKIKRAELEYKERLEYEKSLQRKFKIELERKVEERTKKLNKALEQQKLYLNQIVKASRFKTEFLATMSHELRTPLNAIIGFTDLLLEKVYGPLNDDQLEFVQDIKTSAQHQHEMVARILDISKIESGQMKLEIKKFSLNNIV